LDDRGLARRIIHRWLGSRERDLMLGANEHDAAPDPWNLNRFIQAQEDAYDPALQEIRRGRKQSHWMWYVFPQFAGLGQSTVAKHYSIGSIAEAEAYLAHPLLGPRLIECFQSVLLIQGSTAHEIFGSPDDLKLRSCATLFASISPKGSIFTRLLEKYFEGSPDGRTLQLIATAGR
jgi:uncharacterized protein (DUF1810 family)